MVLAGILLAGCGTTSVPVKQIFPMVPDILLKECDPLNTIDKPTVKLSELMDTVTKNYGKYHGCAAVVEAWQDWYKDQKKVFDDLK